MWYNALTVETRKGGVNMNCSTRKYKIGEVYMMRFSGSGSEQSGWRPGLVYQNNIGNNFSPNIIALPLTTAIKKTSQPTHVVVPRESTGLKRDSMVLCENPERMSKKRIGKFVTKMPDEYMEEIAIASMLATSAISYIPPERLHEVHRKAISLNATNTVA